MNPRYSVSSHLDLGAGTSKSILRFENVKPSDQGSYMCQLNTLGSLGQTGFLTVTGNQFLDTEIPKRFYFQIRFFSQSRHVLLRTAVRVT